jgi:hypothetical protein
MLLTLIIQYCREHVIEKCCWKYLASVAFQLRNLTNLASLPAQNKIDKITWFIYFEIFKPYGLQIETIIAGQEWN